MNRTVILYRVLRPIAVLLAFVAADAYAGGPLGICSDKTPMKYPGAGTVNLNYDLGPLGARSKAQADAIVTSAVALWTNVGTATITIGRGPDLPVDVTTANFSTYEPVFNDTLNPVVYDTDGSVIDLMLGVGAKASVLGVAGSASSGSPCRYVEGRAVINGSIATSDTTLGVTMAHEIGHLIGMDHTQLNATQGIASSGNRPLMYPIANRNTLTLHEDDEAAVSALYPDATLSTVYGEISGTFVLADGITPVKGANLWARETTTNKVYSVVSDYRTQNTGFFRLLLPAGIYNLRAGTILPGFTGGSSVGPYSELATDPSFQAPLYNSGVAMADVTLGNGTPTAFPIFVGCAATVTFRIDGTGTIGGDCSPAGTFFLNVTKASTGTGTVTSAPAGINCGATCSAFFASGTMVTLTATPTGGSIFSGWSGACSGTGTCNVTMNSTTSVTATFLPAAAATEVFPALCQSPISWTKPGTTPYGWTVAMDRARSGICSLKSVPMPLATQSGAANTNKAQISVTGTFLAGGSVSFYHNVSSETSWDCLRFLVDGVPQAAIGSNCAGNGGFGASGNITSWTLVTVPVAAGSRVLTWSYETDELNQIGEDAAWLDDIVLPLVRLTVAKTGAGSGTVTGTGINCGVDCVEDVPGGSLVTLTANPAGGSSFTGWSGGGCSGTGACIVSVLTAPTVTADFALSQFNLNVLPAGTGTGTVTSAPAGINCGATCTFTFNANTAVTLTATPQGGSTFTGWSGAGCSGTSTCMVTMTAITNVSATFDIVVTAPGAPIIGAATPGNGLATIAFTAPASNGGSAILDYTVNCDGGSTPQTATASPITVTGLVNTTLYTCFVRARNAVGLSAASGNVSVTPTAGAALALVSVQSRKMHGGLGPFDIEITKGIPLAGLVSVEPRSTTSHAIVFELNNTVNTNAPGTASVVDGSGPIGSAVAAVNTNNSREVIVTLTGIPDNKRVTVTLTGVNGSFNTSASMGFLVGDVSSSRTVNASDISAVKANQSQPVNNTTARFDIDASGAIGQSDVTAAKARSGLVIP